MQEIFPIYKNGFGMSFQWKRDIVNNIYNKFQVIFRDTGFYMTVEDMQVFSNHIYEAKERGACTCVNANCKNTRNILLRTPVFMIDLAVNKEELDQIDELIKGTLFQIQLDSYLNEVCGN